MHLNWTPSHKVMVLLRVPQRRKVEIKEKLYKPHFIHVLTNNWIFILTKNVLFLLIKTIGYDTKEKFQRIMLTTITV
jgi:hypothetical protein